MNHPQWWLIVVAFLLGLVLTFGLMIGRVKREVPLGVSTSGTTTKIPISGETVSKRRWPWWTSAAVVLVAGVAAAATSTVAAHNRGSSAPSNAPSPSASPAVAATRLAGLLLPAEQIAEIVGAAHMGKGAGVSALIPDKKREIAQADCVSAWNAGQHSVYADTGEIGAYSETLRADEKPLRHIADQTVIAYPTAEAAAKVVANQFAQWSACSGRTVTSTPPPPRTPRLFTFGAVTNTGGILSMTQTSVDNATWGCQRALAARSNVVIDIRACRPDTTNQAVDILDAIAAKIPH